MKTKKQRILIKSLCLATVALLVAAAAAFALAACNKTKTASITDIFKNTESVGEITKYEKQFELPVGWEIYTDSSTSSSQAADRNSDVGYIEELNAFVICKNVSGVKKLSVMKCEDDTQYFTDGKGGMLFPESAGIHALRYRQGLIVCTFDDGTAGAYNSKGKVVIAREKIGRAAGLDCPDAHQVVIDTVIKILDGSMVAVHGNYDHRGEENYTSIYRPTTDGAQSERGELVARVLNQSNQLSYLTGFDGKYVSVTGNSSGSYVYVIPNHAPSDGVKSMTATSKATLSSNGESDYYSEITYLGHGKFLFHEDWTVDSDEEFNYYDGDKYYVFKRYIYTPDNDSRKDYNGNSDKLFIYMTNNYYSSDKAGIDTNAYLKDGYTYANYGLTILDVDGVPYGFYDQFILDSDLNVVMSLTGNYGVQIGDQAKSKVGFFDLVMMGVDGNYFIPSYPSEVNVYNAKGKRIGHNPRTKIQRQQLNNGIIIAGAEDNDNSSSTIYGAFNIYGDELIPFKYTELLAYRGSYTMGVRYGVNGVDGESSGVLKLCLIDPSGKEIAQLSDGNKPFYDIAFTRNTSDVRYAIYKLGCYMFKSADGHFGIKNFNPDSSKNIIMPASMESGSVLYSPSSSPKNVFVFDKQTVGDNVSYTVYKLI